MMTHAHPFVSRLLSTPAISPLRALAIGLSPADVCAWYRLTQEQLDELTQARDEHKQRTNETPTKPGTLMTKLLLRPDLDDWESKTTERL